jgi:tol-pal system protein YbgF
MLELQNQIELLRGELANQRGRNERLERDVADLQRQQKNADEQLEERLRKLEPVKVTVDGREFSADPAEQRGYDEALAIFKRGDFVASQAAFAAFLRRYPRSGYAPSSLFWLGNAQYATRNYNEAIINFREVIALAPDHMRAPEAALSMANCQIELKDVKAARKTLTDLVKVYPQSEAAASATDRLNRLK